MGSKDLGPQLAGEEAELENMKKIRPNIRAYNCMFLTNRIAS
jgi:hypothetical protein